MIVEDLLRYFSEPLHDPTSLGFELLQHLCRADPWLWDLAMMQKKAWLSRLTPFVKLSPGYRPDPQATDYYNPFVKQVLKAEKAMHPQSKIIRLSDRQLFSIVKSALFDPKLCAEAWNFLVILQDSHDATDYLNVSVPKLYYELTLDFETYMIKKPYKSRNDSTLISVNKNKHNIGFTMLIKPWRYTRAIPVSVLDEHFFPRTRDFKFRDWLVDMVILRQEATRITLLMGLCCEQSSVNRAFVQHDLGDVNPLRHVFGFLCDGYDGFRKPFRKQLGRRKRSDD